MIPQAWQNSAQSPLQPPAQPVQAAVNNISSPSPTPAAKVVAEAPAAGAPKTWRKRADHLVQQGKGQMKRAAQFASKNKAALIAAGVAGVGLGAAGYLAGRSRRQDKNAE